jgi:tRNA-specific 2-thiouridylase
LLYRREFVASRLNIISQPALDKTVRVKAKIRYKHKEAEAVLKQDGKDRVRVLFIKPQRAITPGQAVVFYDGETVVGGGIID